MKIDDETYERILDETPIPDLDPTWRTSSFMASRKWCDFARFFGQREGFGMGLFITMIVLALVNVALVLFDVERGWASAVVPALTAVIAVVWTGGKITHHRLYMYGESERGSDKADVCAGPQEN